MRDLNYQLKQLCRRNRDGSFATQADRERMLSLFANQLREMGFRHMRADSLKPKHVEALVERWKAEGISAGTFKNRLSVLRWWAEKIGKPNVVARDNDAYGIERRQYVTNRDKGKDLDQGQVDRIRSPYVAMSLRLQEAFGLRREESIKIRPGWADQGNALRLKASWTKGGRDRELPIRIEAQRVVLDEAKKLAAGRSLIPQGSTYKEQLERLQGGVPARRAERQSRPAAPLRPDALLREDRLAVPSARRTDEGSSSRPSSARSTSACGSRSRSSSGTDEGR